MAIDGVTSVGGAQLAPVASPTRVPDAGDGGGFSDTLLAAIDSARTQEQVANDSANRFAAGDPEMGIHEALIAAEKANVSVRFAVALKNKVIEAYRELMNTQV
jgi:flagellar hook-basal body complex protein FliE